MYNEQLEQLISAALADGVLTEKEKQILFKKAQSMGVDLDEFEMVLDARLVELAKAEKAKAEASAPKSNKLGDVKKCPSCGAIVQSYQGVCPECGYAFEDLEANKSSKELAKIIAAESSPVKAATKISAFPIPTTKSDLIEFISSLQTRLNDKELGEAYKSKSEECILKAKTLFPNDKMMMQLVDTAEKSITRSGTKKKAKLIFIVACAVLVGVGCIFLFKPNPTKNIQYCASQIDKALSQNDLKKAEELITSYRGQGKEFIERKTSLIADMYVANGDISSAQDLLNKGMLKYGSEKLYDYYIEQRDYEKAWPCIVDNNLHYRNDLERIVLDMCNNGDKSLAKQFVKRHINDSFYYSFGGRQYEDLFDEKKWSKELETKINQF